MEEINTGIQKNDGDSKITLDDNISTNDFNELNSLSISNTNPDIQLDQPVIIENNQKQTDDIIQNSEPVAPKVEENIVIENPIKENNFFGKKFFTLKKDSEKVESKKEVELKKVEIAEVKKAADLFVNYDSEFHKNEKSIMQGIRKFKMTTSKTSIGFVATLVVFTIVSVSIMVKIDPKNQSIDNYKASVLSIFGMKNNEDKTPNNENPNTGVIVEPVVTDTNTGVIVDPLVTDTNTGVIVDPLVTDTNTGVIVDPLVTDTNTGVIADPLVTDTNTGVIADPLVTDTNTGVIADPLVTDTNTGVIPENKGPIIKEKWLTISPEVITKEDLSVSYVYKGKTYTKEELQVELKKEVQVEIDKKTKDYLNKLYINK